MDSEARWEALAEPPPRRRLRRTRVVVAALLSVGVVLVGLVWLGSRFGANQLPGDRVEAGVTGAEIFRRNCAQCHGPRGEGGPRVSAPAFTPGGPLAPLSFEERVEKIGRGRPLRGMPRFEGKLTEDEIRKVAAYTQTLSGQQPQPGVEGVR